MRKLALVLCCAVLAIAGIGPAQAWYIKGYVYCDNNMNGSIDEGDSVVEHAVVNIENLAGTYFDSMLTDHTGVYWFNLPHVPDDYRLTLTASSLPDDAVIVQPPGGEYLVSLDDMNPHAYRDWLIDSDICQDGLCWMTGGGVKFNSTADMYMAEKGPQHSMGGNVHPSCDPDPGEGGQWNHVAHKLKLHFLGRAIHTVACGNVPGIEPGSESPVTPFNFIEFQGTGTLKGIKGNKVDYGTVHFFARGEDRNEPGSRGAKAGADIDRYFIHVYSDPANPVGTTLLLLDIDGDPATVDPVTITGGNIQLHISSCDNPPD